MELGKEFDCVSGNVPEYGAIFMSNTATKRECWKQKIFGLPYSQAYFVEQVKAGMILFLYEFEKKMLYGVFQACSDGALNIVPNAYKSSGKQFPAQVPFSIIWNCSPLTEREFCGAIKENYYSAHKFNFGLSKVQVRRLLQLFSSRRLKDQLPQKQVIENALSKPIRYPLGEERRDADSSSFLCNRVENELDMENDIGPIMLRGNSQFFRDKARNIAHNVRSAENESLRYEHTVNDDHESSFYPEYLTNSLSDVRRTGGNGKAAVDDGAGSAYYEDSNCVAATSGRYFGGWAVGDSSLSISNRKGHGHNRGSPYKSARQPQHFGNQLDGGTQLCVDREFVTRDDKWNKFNNRYNGENEAVTVQPTSYSIESMDKLKTVAGDDVKFVHIESETQEQIVDNDFRSLMSSKYVSNRGVLDYGVAANYCRLSSGDRMRNEPNADLDYGPVISAGYSGACPKSLNPLMCPGQEMGNILAWDQPGSSPASLRTMEPPNSNLPYLAQQRDADVKNTDTYDSEKGNILFWDQSMKPMELPNSNVPHLADRRDVGKVTDTYDPEFSSIQYRYTPSSVPFMHSLGAGNANDIIGPFSHLSSFSRNSFSVVDHGHPSVPEVKFKHQTPYREDFDTSKNVSMSTRNKSHLQKDKYENQMPYCDVSDGFQADIISTRNKGDLQEYKLENQMPYHRSSEAFTEDVSMSTESRCCSRGFSSLQSKGIHSNTHSAISHDLKDPKSVKGRLSGCPKNRPSVFSRLSVAPKVRLKENDSHMVADESSFGVNDIMGMLDRSHFHWVKKSKFKHRQNSDVETFRGASVPPDTTPDSEMDKKEVVEGTTIVNFKRRSELRKVVDESKAKESDSVENSNKESPLPGLGKKRKLIRPKFP